MRCGAQEAKKPDFSGLFWHSSMSVSNDGVAAERERFVGLIRVKLQRRLVGQKHGPRCQTIAVTAPTRTPGVLPCSRPRYRGPVAPRRAATGCEPGPYGVLVTGTSTAQGCCWLRCGSKPLASAAGGPDSCDLPGLAASCRSDRARVPACLAILPNIPGLRLVGASDDAHGPGLGLARRVVAGR